MRVKVKPGTYVVAVSGGVDSMVLLDLLRGLSDIKLIVAHFDHGIRLNSAQDRILVQARARKYNLPFVYSNGHLGPDASESAARDARYAFLEKVKKASGARAIITAHHQDDLIETAILNLIRGSGRSGLTSLKSTNSLMRPLLGYDKKQIYEYAKNHTLRWNEDSTNIDTKYKRNHVRHNIMPSFTPGKRAQFLIILEQLQDINHDIDANVANLLHIQLAPNVIDRSWFIRLPHKVSQEVMYAWLKRHNIKDLTHKNINKLVISAKTSKPRSKFDISAGSVLIVGKHDLALRMRER
ncbi:MAG: tRNA lysidine(34) synthetase TilS [Candidatus Saccharimonadales bacterium]